MLKICVSLLLRFILWSCLAVLPLAHSAWAKTYVLHADTMGILKVSSFTIKFEDVNNNQRLDNNEIGEFSGMTDFDWAFPPTVHQYDAVRWVPEYNILQSPYTNGDSPFPDNVYWAFVYGDSSWLYHRANFWTYRLTEVPLPHVPLELLLLQD
jgi:hypothetical protein